MARLKPLPRSERLIKYGGTQNRGNIKRRTNDEVKNVEVGLLDVDASIMYYFNFVVHISTHIIYATFCHFFGSPFISLESISSIPSI